MAIFKIEMATRVSVVVGLLVAATMVGAGVAVGSGALQSDNYRRGQATATEPNAEDTIIATAGGVSITAREFQEAELHLQYMKQMAEKELQGLGEDTDLPTDFLQDRHNLVIKWGEANAALASLIQEHVLHQKATELGHEVTDKELEESKEWARDAYERGELDGYTQGYIDSIGADHYWDNIYPALATRSMATEKLYDGVAAKAGTQSHDEVRVHWHDFEEEVIADAEITVPESKEHLATLEGVMGFLNDVRETNRAHLRGLY